MPRRASAFIGVGLLLTGGNVASAEEVELQAVMVPQEQIRLDFEDGSKHFVLFVRRGGKAEGVGPLDGTKVTEYGMHDIVPGEGGEPIGYLRFQAEDGSLAYVRWRVRAVFVPGSDGKPQLLDNGLWEIVGGTGQFSELAGAGTLNIKPVNETDRRFILRGDLRLAQ